MMRERGFSLIELLAAAAIMGILAMVAVPVIETTVRREKERELRKSLRDIRSAIDAYKAASDAGCIPKQFGDSGYPPSLADLAAGVRDQRNPSGAPLYFLRRVPRDPFGPAQGAAPLDAWGLRSSVSEAEHPQPGEDVFDVYSRSAGQGLNGVPYSEW